MGLLEQVADARAEAAGDWLTATDLTLSRAQIAALVEARLLEPHPRHSVYRPTERAQMVMPPPLYEEEDLELDGAARRFVAFWRRRRGQQSCPGPVARAPLTLEFLGDWWRSFGEAPTLTVIGRATCGSAYTARSDLQVLSRTGQIDEEGRPAGGILRQLELGS